MQSFNESGPSRRAGIATMPAPPSQPNRPPRRRWTRLLLAVLALGLLALSLVFLGLGDAWQALEQLGRLGRVTPSASQVTSSTTAPATASPAASPMPQGTSRTGLTSNTQGCALESVAPDPGRFPIYSARGYPGTEGEVALTFDDGPSPLYTPQILDELKAAGAHATFFVVGAHAQRFPNVVRAELAGGNAVGNHTYTHLNLPGQPVAVMRVQLTTTTTTLRGITHDNCLWLFRPPYGGIDSSVFAEAHREGLTTVLWDVWALDWLRPGANVIAQRIISQLHSGAIILLHDSAPDNEIPDRSQTVAALPAILRAIRAQGLRTVTLPQLLSDARLIRLHGAPPVPGAPAPPSATPSIPPDAESLLQPPVAEIVHSRLKSLPPA